MKIFSRFASDPKLYINWVKTKPRLAGSQIPFGGNSLGFVYLPMWLSIIEVSLTSLINLVLRLNQTSGKLPLLIP